MPLFPFTHMLFIGAKCWKEIAYWDICCDKIKAKDGKSVAVPHS